MKCFCCPPVAPNIKNKPWGLGPPAEGPGGGRPHREGHRCRRVARGAVRGGSRGGAKLGWGHIEILDKAPTY